MRAIQFCANEQVRHIGRLLLGSIIAAILLASWEWAVTPGSWVFSQTGLEATGQQKEGRYLQEGIATWLWRAALFYGWFGNRVQLDQLGQVQGISLGGDVDQYLGIPYAVPPTGALRFRPSRPLKQGWEGVWHAKTFGPSCIQGAGNTQYKNISEDCLYLNVWAPAKSSSRPHPVFVWIHGGAFIVGSGQDYNGTFLASKGLVVVTFNYRLAGLGFYASKALAKEDSSFPSNGGMNGIGDQILALEWVRDHISQFGGDPTQVTVAGESSGGISVSYLMHAPAAKGLFQKAVAESGSCVISSGSGLPYPTSQAEGTSVGWELEFGCVPGLPSTLDCMRKVSADKLVKGAWYGLRPSIDGVVMPGDPYDLPISTLPQSMITGSTSLDTVCAPPWDDGSGTGPARTKPWPTSCTTYKEKLIEIFVLEADAVEQHYPCPENASKLEVGQQWLKMSRDVSISCPVRWLADKVLATASNSSMYLYEFAYNPDPAWLGLATHGAELGYIFNDEAVGYYPNKHWNPQLADLMSGYWSSFALWGEPQGSTLWPRYTSTGYHAAQFLHFDSTTEAMTGYHTEACAFWQDYLKPTGIDGKWRRDRYKKMVNQCFN